MLLAAARDLFAEFGFDATSTHQIATRAGVSEGILFHHFGTKKNLFIELLKDYAHAASTATMPRDPAQMTEESVVRNAFAFAEANPAIYDMLALNHSELTDAEINSQSDIITAAIEQNLQRGMDEGNIRVGDASIMAQLQFAVVDAAYRAWRRDSDPSRKEDYILEAVNCMKAMLAPDHTPDSDP